MKYNILNNEESNELSVINEENSDNINNINVKTKKNERFLYLLKNSKRNKVKKDKEIKKVKEKIIKDFQENNQLDKITKNVKLWKKIKILVKFICALNNELKNKKIYGITNIIHEKITNKTFSKGININKKYWLLGKYYKNNNNLNRKWYILYENSVFKIVWNLFMFVNLIYIALVIPYKISFIENQILILDNIDLAINFIFMADIIINLFSSYINYYYEEIDDIKLIIKNYAQQWLIFDLISVIPFELLITNSNSLLYNFNDFAKLLRITRLFKIFRIFKIFKTNYFKKVDYFFNLNKQIKDLLIFIVIIFLIIYIFSCLWHLIAFSYNYNNNTWVYNYYTSILELKVNEINFNNHIEKLFQFLLSFYWSICTVSTVGYGDIYSNLNNFLEIIFNIIWLTIGVGFYSYVVSTISYIINKSNTNTSILSIKLSFLDDFIKKKIHDYLLKDKFVNNISNNTIIKLKNPNLILEFFDDINNELQNKITKKMYNGFINKFILLKKMDKNFKSKLVSKLIYKKYLKHEKIYLINDFADSIYFITKGSVGFLTEDNLIVRKFTNNSYFGELEIYKSTVRLFTVVALEELELLMLKREDFLSLMKNYPEEDEFFSYNAMIKYIYLKRSVKDIMKINSIYRLIRLNEKNGKDIKIKLLKINNSAWIEKLKKEINNIVFFIIKKNKKNNIYLNKNKNKIIKKNNSNNISELISSISKTNNNNNFKFDNNKNNYNNNYLNIDKIKNEVLNLKEEINININKKAIILGLLERLKPFLLGKVSKKEIFEENKLLKASHVVNIDNKSIKDDNIDNINGIDFISEADSNELDFSFNLKEIKLKKENILNKI